MFLSFFLQFFIIWTQLWEDGLVQCLYLTTVKVSVMSWTGFLNKSIIVLLVQLYLWLTFYNKSASGLDI